MTEEDNDRELEQLIYEVLFGEPMTQHPEQENLDSYNDMLAQAGKEPVSMEFFLKRKNRFQPVAPLIILDDSGNPIKE